MLFACVCMYVCRYTRTANCRVRASFLSVVLYGSLSILFALGQLVTEALGTSCLHLLRARVKVCSGTSTFCVGARDLHSWPHTCGASPLPTEPFPYRLFKSYLICKVYSELLINLNSHRWNAVLWVEKNQHFLAYSALKFLLFTTALKITKMSSHVPVSFKYA